MKQGNKHQHGFRFMNFFPSITKNLVFVAFLVSLSYGSQLLFGDINKNLFSWPGNIIIVSLLVILTLLLGIFFKENSIVKWLSSLPAAIGAIVAFSLLTLLMGIIPQHTDANVFISKFSLNNISTSWPFLISLFYFLFTLGFAAVSRLNNFKRKNFWFLLNHAGLWVAVAAAGFGSGDVLQYRLWVDKGEVSWFAYDLENHHKQLPFKIKLYDFNLEENTPKLTIVNTDNYEYLLKSGKNSFESKENNVHTLFPWKTTVKLFYNSANCFDGIFCPNDSIGAVSASYVEVLNLETKETVTGWVSCGNSEKERKELILNHEHSLIMFSPEPKRIISSIEIIENEKIIRLADVEVNKPLKYDGWYIYQLSYDESMGKKSNRSFLELIRDPWLPVVNIGFAMMIVGAFFVFWRGKKTI
jgi:hypothetical protein